MQNYAATLVPPRKGQHVSQDELYSEADLFEATRRVHPAPLRVDDATTTAWLVQQNLVTSAQVDKMVLLSANYDSADITTGFHLNDVNEAVGVILAILSAYIKNTAPPPGAHICLSLVNTGGDSVLRLYLPAVCAMAVARVRGEMRPYVITVLLHSTHVALSGMFQWSLVPRFLIREHTQTYGVGGNGALSLGTVLGLGAIINLGAGLVIPEKDWVV